MQVGRIRVDLNVGRISDDRQMTMRQMLIKLITTVFLLVAVSVTVNAQEPVRVWRIGFLGPGSYSSDDPRVEALRRGLRELGYLEGRNLAFEFRWARGNANRLPALAAELAKLKVDAIVTQGTQATDAARRAVTTIPIVFSVAGDPIGSGLVTSLARPGGNVTGLTDIAPEIAGKRLELLREAVPSIARIAILWNPANPSGAPQMQDTGAVARSLGLPVRSLELRDVGQLEAAFETAIQGQARAVVVLSDGVLYSRRGQIAQLAAKHRLACVAWTPEFADSGCLMTYGADVVEMHRRAAMFVDKILRGANPGGLPVEQPTKFELVVNLKTAKALGLRIAPTVLARADRIIE
jgi:putative tryptophan/tyrosine transport system substrate-binding protein